MLYVLYTVHVITCIFLILVVLLQQGKGADLSVFGGGSTQAAFGARGAATLLHKLTVGCFVMFIITTLSIGIAQRKASSSSVLSGVASGDAAKPAAADTQPANAGDATAPAPAAEPAEEGGDVDLLATPASDDSAPAEPAGDAGGDAPKQ